MNRVYIVTIILLILALIFAIQNTATLSLNFLVWSFAGSQALIIVVILFTGFISGWLLGLSKVWRKNQQIKFLNRKIKTLESNPAQPAAPPPPPVTP